jgi:hypothetical protein
MYAGVPTAWPCAVPSAPSSVLAVGSAVVSPPAGAAGSVNGLAKPQSTTRVSPNGPSMTLAGFKSRWITVRLWAYATVLQTATKCWRSWRNSTPSKPTRGPGWAWAWNRWTASWSDSPSMNRMA